MIDWNLKNNPKSGKRIAIQLPDGRICSGMVNKEKGFELEYVDNMDLMSYMLSNEQKWIYLEEDK